MCLIVYKSGPSQHFSNKNFKSMISRNGDGLGMMYREDGRVKVVKSVGDAQEKFALFREHRDKPDWAMHSRFKTHGDIDEKNCHPYKVMDIDEGDPIDLYMMHNGVLSNAPNVDKSLSDTWHYVEYILKPMVKSAGIDILWENEHIQQMLQEHIGKTNKFLFMRSDDTEYPVLILNHASGVERNGMWLSNTYSIQEHTVNRGHYTGHNYSAQNSNYVTRMQESYAERQARLVQEAEDKQRAEDTEFAKLLKEEQEAEDKIDAEQSALTNKQVSGTILPINDNSNILDKKTTIILPNGNTLKVTKVDDIHDHYMQCLNSIRGLSDFAVKDYIKDDPENVADIILALYNKNTMRFNTILAKCKSNPNEIVNILRNMTVDYKTKMLA